MQIVTASGHSAITEDRRSQLIQIFHKTSEDVYASYFHCALFSQKHKSIYIRAFFSLRAHIQMN